MGTHKQGMSKTIIEVMKEVNIYKWVYDLGNDS